MTPRDRDWETALEFVDGSQILLTDFDSTGFELQISQILGLSDTISNHRTDIDLNKANIETLQSSSHPEATLTTDDATVLSLNESTQGFTFNSSLLDLDYVLTNGNTSSRGATFGGNVGIGTSSPSGLLDLRDITFDVGATSRYRNLDVQSKYINYSTLIRLKPAEGIPSYNAYGLTNISVNIQLWEDAYATRRGIIAAEYSGAFSIRNRS